MARYSAGHKQESLSRIVNATGRGFRKHGFSGIGVDDLAKEAGVTHAAFTVIFDRRQTRSMLPLSQVSMI